MITPKDYQNKQSAWKEKEAESLQRLCHKNETCQEVLRSVRDLFKDLLVLGGLFSIICRIEEDVFLLHPIILDLLKDKFQGLGFSRDEKYLITRLHNYLNTLLLHYRIMVFVQRADWTLLIKYVPTGIRRSFEIGPHLAKELYSDSDNDKNEFERRVDEMQLSMDEIIINDTTSKSDIEKWIRKSGDDSKSDSISQFFKLFLTTSNILPTIFKYHHPELGKRLFVLFPEGYPISLFLKKHGGSLSAIYKDYYKKRRGAYVGRPKSKINKIEKIATFMKEYKEKSVSLNKLYDIMGAKLDLSPRTIRRHYKTILKETKRGSAKNI